MSIHNHKTVTQLLYYHNNMQINAIRFTKKINTVG